MLRRIICGILSAILVTGLIGLSVSANGESVYEFVIDDIHHTVTIDGISEEFREYVATQLIGIDDEAQPYSLKCMVFGHLENIGTASHTMHKVYSYAPRCVVYVYEVTTCTRCGELLDEVLVSQKSINCCPVG